MKGVGIYIYDHPDVCSTPPSSRPDGILCVVWIEPLSPELAPFSPLMIGWELQGFRSACKGNLRILPLQAFATAHKVFTFWRSQGRIQLQKLESESPLHQNDTSDDHPGKDSITSIGIWESSPSKCHLRWSPMEGFHYKHWNLRSLSIQISPLLTPTGGRDSVTSSGI